MSQESWSQASPEASGRDQPSTHDQSGLPTGELPRLDTTASIFLTAVLGHELRTPLHSLLGFLELLAEFDLTDEQQRLVEQVMSGADSLLVAGDRVSMLVRLLAEDYQLCEDDEINLPELLGEVAAAHSTSGDTVQVRVYSDVPTTVLGDAGLLRQVLFELTENATTHGERPIVLTAQRAPTSEDATEVAARDEVMLLLSVVDHGVGLPQELTQALLADPGPDTTTGTGLFLANRLSRLAGGGVRAVAGPNGTHELQVRVRTRFAAPEAQRGHPNQQPRQALPAGSALPEQRSTSASSAPSEPGHDTRPDTGPLRILLAEDNPVNSLLAERQMKRLGHHLTVVPNGFTAVDLALSQDFDVVMLDRHLPDIDGEVAAAHIRTGERSRGDGRRVPIVAVTADASAQAREVCLAAGMDAFLTKPLDLEVLTATLARFREGAPADQTGVPGGDEKALRRLFDQFGHDATAVAGLVHTYLSELPGRRLLVQAALRRGSVPQLRAAISSLTSASRTVGATAVAQLTAQVSRAADEGDWATVRELLPAVLNACHATEAWLRPYASPATWPSLLTRAG